MRKDDFLRILEQSLLDLNEADRIEALQYYIDYFEDAGVSSEEDVTLNFGNPEKIAARIKIELSEEHSEYSEQGFEDVRFQNNARTMLGPVKREVSDNVFEEKEEIQESIVKSQKKEEKIIDLQREDENKKVMSTGKIISIVALLLLTSPVWITIAAAGFALILSIILLFVAIGLGGMFAGPLLIYNGINKFIYAPELGLISMGVGSLAIAVGILAILTLIWTGVKVTPPLVKAIKKGFYDIKRYIKRDVAA